MENISRRDFLAVAAVLGAEAAWGRSFSTPSKISWRERRDLFPEGVASGDPDSNSVLLWTRRAPEPKPAQELVEAMEHQLPKDAPLRALFLGQGPGANRPQPTINMLVRHGVRSCLEYAKSGDVQKARRLSNRDLSPHVSFVDMGGHGYSVVHAAADRLETEFICLPRPIVHQDQPDGGPILYRVRHAARLWRKHERPNLEQKVIEGNPAFSI